MKKFFVWFLIGKLTIEVWSALLPQEQAFRMVVMVKEFVEMQSCSKVVVDVSEDETDVIIKAKCTDYIL